MNTSDIERLIEMAVAGKTVAVIGVRQVRDEVMDAARVVHADRVMRVRSGSLIEYGSGGSVRLLSTARGAIRGHRFDVVAVPESWDYLIVAWDVRPATLPDGGIVSYA